MGHRIDLNEAALERYHQDQLDAIYLRWFHPESIGTNIKNYHITPAELAAMSEHDAMGREAARGLGGSAGHKCTNFHRDPDYCNGLPRRR